MILTQRDRTKTKTKVKIALPLASSSDFVAEAIDRRTALEDLDTMLDEMLAETGGPATAAESRAARRTLRAPVSRRRK